MILSMKEVTYRRQGKNILSQYITTGSSSSTDQGTTETATTEKSDK